MFKVIRSNKPSDWKGLNYKDPLVVHQLAKDFHAKCYLCEQTNFGNPNVEHFISHKGKDNKLKADWENLYYACSHCNGIKGARYDELLDCCNADHNVNAAISLEIPYKFNDPIIVTNTLDKKSPFFELANQTVELLTQCYNNANSGVQQMGNKELRMKIANEFSYLQLLKFEITSKHLRGTKTQKEDLVEQLMNMLKPNYPFSAFWRTYIINDGPLLEILPENFIGSLEAF